MIRNLVITFIALTLPALAQAEIVLRPVEYKHADVALEGTLAFDSAISGKRGGVLIAFEGAANGPAARQRATQFARLGYVAFVADLFGKGIAPKDGADAAARLRLNADRGLVRGRAESALAVLARQTQVDAKRVAAVGYGVGGTALLELARTGADLEGVAVVHGDVSSPAPIDAKKISASVLVIVGSDDPRNPWSQIAAFEDEMRGGGVDWQVLRFGGVAHDFTNPQAGRNLKLGAAYDADAETRANAAIKSFLAESLVPAPAASAPAAKPKPAVPKGVPERVMTVLEHVDRHHEAMQGYEGGRTFGNFERLLPATDSQGRRIRYREWDVNPLRPGVNRGAERLITGSDGSANYTDDHYRSFKKIR